MQPSSRHSISQRVKFILRLGVISLGLHTLTSQAALTVTNIAQGCDTDHSLFLKSDGSLWAMGYNSYGELGDGTVNSTNRPELIVSNGVAAIAAGKFHSLFLKTNGSLWAMGGNISGQLGDGTYNSTNRCKQIITGGVTEIAASGYHSLFVKSDGSLWVMGNNDHGQLGIGIFKVKTNLPTQIVSDGVTAIAAGELHSLFLKSNGSLWGMGDNRYGGLGDGTYSTVILPKQIVANGVTAIAAGGYHSLFLKSDGSLWAMGANIDGELGDGTYNNTNQPKQIVTSGVTAIAAGFVHSLFLRSDGSLWAMGNNFDGELGDGTYSTNRNPYGINQPKQIVAEGVTAIAGGDYHSLFLKSDGSLWVMGRNNYGQLGDGFPSGSVNCPLPEQIFPVPAPILSNALSSQTNLQLTATCGFGGKFRLLGSTYIDQPLDQWTRLNTNSVTTRGTNNYSVTLTNAVNSGQRQFYILQSQ